MSHKREMAISVSALEIVSNFFIVHNTAVRVFVNGISVFYIMTWARFPYGRGGLEGISVDGFSYVEPT